MTNIKEQAENYAMNEWPLDRMWIIEFVKQQMYEEAIDMVKSAQTFLGGVEQHHARGMLYILLTLKVQKETVLVEKDRSDNENTGN